MNEAPYHFPKTGIHKYIAQYIQTLPPLSGKVVLDVPCGDGRGSYEFLKKGAEVKALDLFPEFIQLKELDAEFADLSETLPLEDESVDYILCQEGIEHIPNQLQVLQEFNRVLKKGGVLLLTTPNNSHVRARISHFFLESDYWKRMPPTEIDGLWFSKNNSNKLYFGHLFLLGVQHFQSLVTFTGFKTEKRIQTDFSNSSMILGIALFPFFLLFSLLAFFLYKKKNPHVLAENRTQILWKRVTLNLSAKTLFCKHLFWVLRKEQDRDEVIATLKAMQRQESWS